jgi:hypothetical protein
VDPKCGFPSIKSINNALVMERKGTVEPIIRNYWPRKKIQKQRRKRRREKTVITRA